MRLRDDVEAAVFRVGSAVDDDPAFRAEKVSPAGRLAASVLERMHALLFVTLSALRPEVHQIAISTTRMAGRRLGMKHLQAGGLQATP
jgi:hypothetical protein